ncbi:MAG: hypothetical protein LBR75_01315 [Prevotellaceae bacterium]|nr:hypothetical protein [Prevotellaceae bacterium]
MKKLVGILAVLFCLSVQAQVLNFAESEQKLLELFKQMQAETGDEQRIALSGQIEYELLLALQDPLSFDYPFDSLTALGKVYADDRQLRVYTWNVSLKGGKAAAYGGIVQQKQSKDQPYTVVSLKTPESVGSRPPGDKVLMANEWYGALYYRAIPVKQKNRTYYVLLGWSANDGETNFKVIEPLMFDSRNRLLLGRNLFRVERKVQPRVIFEYGAQNRMTLEYDKKSKQIIFDHLSPSSSQYEGIYSFYGPDFSYDAYQLNKDRWQLMREIEPPKNTIEQERPVFQIEK